MYKCPSCPLQVDLITNDFALLNVTFSASFIDENVKFVSLTCYIIRLFSKNRKETAFYEEKWFANRSTNRKLDGHL